MLMKIAVLCVLILISGALMETASASGNHDHGDINITINHNDDDGGGSAGTNGVDGQSVDTNGCLCATGGVSDSDLSRGLSLAMTAGAHELDYSTQDWQLSVTYAMQVDEDEEGAYSAKIGKRWDRFGKALMHVTFVPEQGQDYGNWVVMGGTIRF
jgi:hypothetical protein